MKLLYYEFKKLAGARYLAVMLAVMLAACAFFLRLTCESIKDPPDRELERAYEAFFNEYSASPERIDALAAEFDAYNEAVMSAEQEYDSTHQIPVDATDEEKEAYYVGLEAVLSQFRYENRLGLFREDGSEISDGLLFRALASEKDRLADYDAFIERAIKSAESVMHRCELIGAENTPLYEHNKHTYEAYSALRGSVAMEPGHMSGWAEFLGFDELEIFVYIYLILVSVVLFLSERTNGFLPVLRTTRHGRYETAAGKLVAVSIVSVAATVLFTAAIYAECAFTVGFTDASAPVQTCFRECPYKLTLGQYALVLLGIRCLCSVSFSVIIGLAASLSFSPIISYAAGAVVLVSGILTDLTVSSSDRLLINLVRMSTTRLTSTFSEFAALEHSISTAAAGICLYAAVTVVFAAASVILCGRRSLAPKPSVKKSVWRPEEIRLRAADIKRKKRYPSSLYLWECSKLMTPILSFAALLLLIASAYDAFSYYRSANDSIEKEYAEYIERSGLLGELTEEKRNYINERSDYVSQTIDDYEKMAECLTNGEITSEEYSEYLLRRSAASKEESMIRRLREQVSYIEKAGGGWIMPTASVDGMLGRDINVFLLAVILIVFVRSYAADYAAKSSEGNFASILRTAKRGRRETWRAKALATLTLSFGITMLFEAADIAIGAAETEHFFSLMNAPVMSIERYGAFGEMTAWKYLLLVLAVRVLSYVALAFFICSVSFIVKRISATLFVAASTALLPYMLVNMGVRVMRYIDITAALAGGKLITRSAEMGLFGSTFGFAAALLGGLLAVAVAATLAVRHKTGK